MDAIVAKCGTLRAVFSRLILELFQIIFECHLEKVLFLMFYFPLSGNKLCLDFAIIFTNLFFLLRMRK